jgi:hypothetical protein
MSITETLETSVAVDFSGVSQDHSPLIDQLSAPIVGKWNVLVSQTNWEKGALILGWRSELIAAGLPNTVYSDEAWARLVGNVSPQHVGKLRRVAERFGEKNRNFSGLYWSHFNAALDWDDAELWLEGAVQNDWSVAQMRVQRWETIGASDEQKPHEEDILVTEIDEDAYYRQPDRIEGRISEIGSANALDGSDVEADNVRPATEPSKKKEQPKKDRAKTESSEHLPTTKELLMSLASVSDFPTDLAEPLELLKVAILNHKLAGWKSIPAERVCRSLEALKMLTSAEDR